METYIVAQVRDGETIALLKVPLPPLENGNNHSQVRDILRAFPVRGVLADLDKLEIIWACNRARKKIKSQ